MSGNSPLGPPSHFFGVTKCPKTPGTQSPINPFAPEIPEELMNTALGQPAAKRRRIEIEPVEVKPRVDNVFFTRPPLTPTSPLVSTPVNPFQSIPQQPTTPITPSAGSNPFGLNGFSEDLDSIMDLSGDFNQNITDEEVQAFVDIMAFVFL